MKLRGWTIRRGDEPEYDLILSETEMGFITDLIEGAYIKDNSEVVRELLKDFTYATGRQDRFEFWHGGDKK